MKDLQESLQNLVKVNQTPISFVQGNKLGNWIAVSKTGTHLNMHNELKHYTDSYVGQIYDNNWFCIHEKGGLDKDLTLFDANFDKLGEVYASFPKVSTNHHFFTEEWDGEIKIFQVKYFEHKKAEAELFEKKFNGTAQFWNNGYYAFLPKHSNRTLYDENHKVVFSDGKKYKVYHDKIVGRLVNATYTNGNHCEAWVLTQEGKILVPEKRLASNVKVWGHRFGYKIDNYTWQICDLETDKKLEIVKNAYDLDFLPNGFKAIKENTDTILDIYDWGNNLFSRCSEITVFSNMFFSMKTQGIIDFYREDKKLLLENYKGIWEMKNGEFLFLTNTSFFMVDFNIPYEEYKTAFLSLSKKHTCSIEREYFIEYAKLVRVLIGNYSIQSEYEKALNEIFS